MQNIFLAKILLYKLIETFAQTPARDNFIVARCSKCSCTACTLRFLRAVRLEFDPFVSLCKGF